MDVQIPQTASSGTSGSTNTQSASRPGQGGGRHESSGSGKSFRSELRDRQIANTSRHEIGPCQADRDESHAITSSDEPESKALASSCATKDGHACERTAEPVRHDTDTAAPAVVSDVTTQSALLALIAQPAINPDSQPSTQSTSTEQTNTAMESVMLPVMEDGASLPVTAADSSIHPQGESKEITAQPAELAAAIPSGTVLSSTADTKEQPISPPGAETILISQSQPIPEELRDARREKPVFSPNHEAQPHDSVKVEANSPPVALSNAQLPEVTDHQRESVTALTGEQVRRPEEHRPVVTERPVPAQEPSEPQENPASRHTAVASTAWQEFTNEDHQSGMEWSGRDQRDRPSTDQVMAHSPVSEISGPAVPSHPTLLVNGADQRAFSSAPAASPAADARPAVTTPPVQPADWLAANSASQTKSMVIELSQADLGRVNIRVAVNQDVVHTYFSSDRSDMGQYLQNGQEKLQSALQMSGLDLGRFQVDIDRQSAGRSFQQPASQGQSNGHSSHGESRSPGEDREEFTRETTPRRGMLNLVA